MPAKKRAKAAPAQLDVDLSYITESLRVLARPLDDLVPDPSNPVTHGRKNLSAIRGSLAAFGQRTPIVVRNEGLIVIKGNGVLQVARELGWTHIACVMVDDDHTKAVGYAIADNRASDLHEWDEDAMTRLLHEVETGDEDLQQTFSDLAKELEIVVADGAAEAEGDADGGDSEPELVEKFQILIECKTEALQAELLERFTKEGLECRALIA